MRAISLFMLLSVAGCGFASTDATQFRDPQTGTVVAACGPLIGFSEPVQEAQQGCIESYEKQGWVKITQP